MDQQSATQSSAAHGNRPVKLSEPRPKNRNRRITPEVMRGIAELVAKGHNETSAVLILNKCTPKAWFAFKIRGKRTEQINNLLARTTSLRVDRLVNEVEKAATGTSGIRHDWRAAQYLAGVIEPKFATHAAAAAVTNNNSHTVISFGGPEGLARLVAQYASKVTKALPEALPETAPNHAH